MIRTRFAPSPTGYLHIGGVRTALYNWLFARRHGGRFVLRIDDTDRQRNVEEALQPILRGFRWLGLDWDEGAEVGGPHGPYYQSEKLERYREAARALVEGGFAYRDYATPEEIRVEREAARQRGERFLYSRRWMAETADAAKRFEAEGRAAAIRLKMPREGECVFRDLIRGEMAFDWAREQDHVIQRADGTCLYHLANVVDDHDMGITHVIRAEEHLSNTPRQIHIARGLGHESPEYAHLPYVAEPGSRTKLSKRKLEKYLRHPDFAKIHEHGLGIAEAIGHATDSETFNPVVVDFYETVGYLPEAVVNYLLLLGWALDGETEFFTRERMIESFSLERVNKAAASFDPKKLFAFQEHYAFGLGAEAKVPRVLPYLERAGLVGSPPTTGEIETVSAIVSAAGDRIKVFGDILDYRDFFTADEELVYEEKAFAKRLRDPEDATDLLARFRERLADAAAFDAESLETLLKDFIAAEGINIGRIIHGLRVAVTGRAVGFGIFETLAILGRERCLRRIDRARELAAGAAPGRRKA
jgi:glutamyl-tRNA synthetase